MTSEAFSDLLASKNVHPSSVVKNKVRGCLGGFSGVVLLWCGGEFFGVFLMLVGGQMWLFHPCPACLQECSAVECA